MVVDEVEGALARYEGMRTNYTDSVCELVGDAIVLLKALKQLYPHLVENSDTRYSDSGHEKVLLI